MKMRFNVLLILFAVLQIAYSKYVVASDVELTADNGLEWNQKEMFIRALSNAVVKREDLTLKADEIYAYYRQSKDKKSDDKTEIYLIKAIGNVDLFSPEERLEANEVIYNLDNRTLSALPSANKVVTFYVADVKIVATGKSIYYQDENYATVKNAKVIHSGRVLNADDMVLTFEDNDGKKSNDSSTGDATSLTLSKIVATGNLNIVDGAEMLRGDKATYNAKTGIADITGNVALTQGGGSSLTGGIIQYNMNTGIAKLLPDPSVGKVIGVFKSSEKSN